MRSGDEEIVLTGKMIDFGDGQKKQSKFAVKLICRFHATDTSGSHKFLIKDGRLPRDSVGKQCCFSKSNQRNIFNRKMFRMKHHKIVHDRIPDKKI